MLPPKRLVEGRGHQPRQSNLLRQRLGLRREILRKTNRRAPSPSSSSSPRKPAGAVAIRLRRRYAPQSFTPRRGRRQTREAQRIPLSTAAKVAKHKERSSRAALPTGKCLWRTGGGPCPRHGERPRGRKSDVFRTDRRAARSGGLLFAALRAQGGFPSAVYAKRKGEKLMTYAITRQAWIWSCLCANKSGNGRHFPLRRSPVPRRFAIFRMCNVTRQTKNNARSFLKDLRCAGPLAADDALLRFCVH